MATKFFFGGKYDLIKYLWLNINNFKSKWWDIQEKMIESITTSTFYLKFKENHEKENDTISCYFSCLGWYCFLPTPMAAFTAQASAKLASQPLSNQVGWPRNHSPKNSSPHYALAQLDVSCVCGTTDGGHFFIWNTLELSFTFNIIDKTENWAACGCGKRMSGHTLIQN